MKTTKIIRKSMKTTALLAMACLVLFSLVLLPAHTSGQSKVQKSPGGYHGELDFPISWKHYYTYDEWTKIIHDLQKKYASLADIQTIGKSRQGRDQFLLTITAKSTGKPETKPAMWVDGAIHGNEVNGITCSLYCAWYLLTRYDYDPYIYELVNRTTFYILPGLNVDANDSYVRYPNTANNPREPFRPMDDDGDGLFDEDPTEDIDGDGELSTMYVEDPAGDFKLSPDKRRFVQVEDPREEALRFRRIGSEGFDNDGDGRINEDDLGGPDPNRNFPYDWNLRNGYPYPLSESETRNVMEFWLGQPNIFGSFHFHNTGRLIMFSAPPAARGATLTPEQQRQVQEQNARRLEEMRKTNQYAQLFDRIVDRNYQGDMDALTEIVTMGARILKDYRPTMSGLVGQAQASSYYMLGAYAYLIELWGSPTTEADENKDGRVSDQEMMKWIDIELGGEGWINPHKVKHPDLGEVWLGGTAKKHISRTPPARYMEEEALRNTQFILYSASQFPKVEIDRVEVRPATDNLLWVEVSVKNGSLYPTSSDRTVQMRRDVKDKLTIDTSGNVKQLEVPEGQTILDPTNPTDRMQTPKGKTAEFRLAGKSSQKFAYLVKMDGGSGWIEFEVSSKFGGTAKKRVNLQVGN
ncbi:MAG: M14 family metallopeptidase [Candidatus Aminicenantes bacterium]|nr:M14 family metallopeptidase [Candidatus Aminicenantes bacterium]